MKPLFLLLLLASSYSHATQQTLITPGCDANCTATVAVGNEYYVVWRNVDGVIEKLIETGVSTEAKLIGQSTEKITLPISEASKPGKAGVAVENCSYQTLAKFVTILVQVAFDIT